MVCKTFSAVINTTLFKNGMDTPKHRKVVLAGEPNSLI
jgi:hypothetical protein